MQKYTNQDMKKILRFNSSIVKQGDKLLIIIPKKHHDAIIDYSKKDITVDVYDIEG